MAVFSSYRWPGNVRELNNVIERAMPFTDGSTITIESLPEAVIRGRTTPPREPDTRPTPTPPVLTGAPLPFKDAKDQLIDAFERQYLLDLLDKYDGNVSKAARAADMDRKTITRLMKKHSITR